MQPGPRRSSAAITPLIVAQAVTLTGSAATRFALGLVVYSHDHQVSDLSLVLVAGFVPGLLLTPVVGAAVDRYGPLRFVILGDLVGALVVAALIAAATLPQLGPPDRWTYALASAGFSVASSLQLPAVNATIPRLVEPDALPAANGWVSAAGSVGELLGPVIGGGLLALTGLTTVLALDLASYAVAIGVLATRTATHRRALAGAAPTGAATVWDQLAGGLRDLRARDELLRFVLLGTAFNFVYGMYAVVAQPYVLGFADPGTLGGLYAAFAVGTLTGAALSGRIGAGSPVTGMVAMLAVLGVTMAISGLVPWIPVVAGCWFGSGVGLALLGSLSTTVLHRSTPPERHGRLFAAVQFSAWCVLPVAQVLAGWLSDRVFGVDGLGALVVGLGVALAALAGVAATMRSLWALDRPVPTVTT
ncbi:MAG: MFS transporter [Myxococcota bacterium]